MLAKLIDHIYILMAIILTVYGQIVIKWQVQLAGAFPPELTDKIYFIFGLLLKPWVISCYVATFLVALSWMVAMTKFPLSYAYPFMSLAFVFVLILSNILFKESITIPKLIGITFIVAGVIIGSQK